MEEVFAVCAPGLEPILAQEMTELGLRRPRIFKGPDGAPGWVSIDFSPDAWMRANLNSRCADRILLRVGKFTATRFEDLSRAVSRLPWERFLAPGGAVKVRVRSVRSNLYHEKAVAQRVIDGVGRRLRAAPAIALEEKGLMIKVDADRDLFQVAVDSSGEPLHRRGYRLATAKAPLKETLAAAMIAAGLAPGRGRRFAFLEWPMTEESLWRSVVAHPPAREAGSPRILASDRDAGAVESARSNAARAGVAGRIEFSARAVSAVEPPPGPGVVIANPPYGIRVSAGKDLRDLYAQFGKVLRRLGPRWNATLLTANPRLIGAAGLAVDREVKTMNGGLSVRLTTVRPV